MGVRCTNLIEHLKDSSVNITICIQHIAVHQYTNDLKEALTKVIFYPTKEASESSLWYAIRSKATKAKLSVAISHSSSGQMTHEKQKDV